jgi:hypothetical protein
MNDDALSAAFESCTLPFTSWSHRMHVRVAFLYLSRFGLDEAIDRMRSGIKAYNAAHGVQDGPGMGYHETTTLAFLRLMQRAVEQRGPFQNSHEFCERNPELLEPGCRAGVKNRAKRRSRRCTGKLWRSADSSSESGRRSAWLTNSCLL